MQPLADACGAELKKGGKDGLCRCPFREDQTARKTKGLLNNAVGGVLFIGEA